MSTLALSLRGVSKRFGGVVALDGVDLDVHHGEILALVGPNGAGKSVLVNVITGLYSASSGDVRLAGRDVSHEPAHRRARLGMARTFQNIRLFKRMSVLENVLVANKQNATQPFRSIFKASRKNQIDEGMALLGRVGLAAKADDLAAALPYGEARRLEIARALVTEPELLLLDEPAAGMNDRETEDLASRIADLRAIVPAIVVIEHDMGFLRRLCSRMTVLNYGRKIADGPIGEVLSNKAVVEAYLGPDQ